MSMLWRALGVTAFSCALSACATEAEVVAFAYSASTPQSTVSGSIPVEVIATDLRPRQDRFSSKTDAYGYEHAPISATEPVPVIVEKALVAELGARGFHLGPRGARIEVTIRAFYTRFTDYPEQPFKQDTADARVVLDVVVQGGRTSFAKTVFGENSIRAPTQLHWGGTAAESLAEALRRALTQLVDDPAFRRALSLQTV